MTSDNRLQNIEKTLDNQDKKLNEIAKAINSIAVQNEQIRNIQKDIDEIFPRVRCIENFQAGCPRDRYAEKVQKVKNEMIAANKRIDRFWWSFVPSTITLLSASYALIKIGMGQ